MKQLKNTLIIFLIIIVSSFSLNPLAGQAIEPEDSGPVNLRTEFYGNLENVCGDAGFGVGGSAADQTLDLKGFIDKYGQAAFDVGKQYGIPYETILAQAMLESAFGDSKLSSEYNNFFGIKAGGDWNGPTVSLNGNPELGDSTASSYRVYNSPKEGFRGYAEFITASTLNYVDALEHPGDPIRYLELLVDSDQPGEAAYAEDPAYFSKVSSFIKATQKYIKDNNLFPPSSEVDFASSSPGATDFSSVSCSSGGLQEVVKIAHQEFDKGVQEQPPGCNCGEQIEVYSSGHQEPWCADFVSWVFKEAGLPFSGGAGPDWRIPAVVSMQAWFQNGTNGSEYFQAGEKTPRPGDVAFYLGAQTPDSGSRSHTNIVVAVDGNTMTTIGGNEGHAVKKSQHKIEYGEASLVGFGRMNP